MNPTLKQSSHQTMPFPCFPAKKKAPNWELTGFNQ